MSWRGTSCRSFNVGERRRQHAAAPQMADFFSSDNASAKEQRDAIALAVLHEALTWLTGTGGGVAILDATNTTASRRRIVVRSVADFAAATGCVAPPKVVFLEVLCNVRALRWAASPAPTRPALAVLCLPTPNPGRRDPALEHGPEVLQLARLP